MEEKLNSNSVKEEEKSENNDSSLSFSEDLNNTKNEVLNSTKLEVDDELPEIVDIEDTKNIDTDPTTSEIIKEEVSRSLRPRNKKINYAE